MNVQKIDIYIDTQWEGNFREGRGSYSIVLEINIKGEDVTKEHFGGFKDTSMHRFSILVVNEALKHVKKPCDITIHIDSLYMLNTHKWLGEKGIDKLPGRKNEDVIRKYAELIKLHEITIVNEKENVYSKAMKVQRNMYNFEYVTDYKEEDRL